MIHTVITINVDYFLIRYYRTSTCTRKRPCFLRGIDYIFTRKVHKLRPLNVAITVRAVCCRPLNLRPVFDARPVEFVVGKVAVEQVYLPVLSGSPCQYHSTNTYSISSSSKHYSYQHGKRAMPVKLRTTHFFFFSPRFRVAWDRKIFSRCLNFSRANKTLSLRCTV